MLNNAAVNNNESFLRALETLNEAQREAVEHIEGPVLVIAGPGTGKTHILAARIGRILQETDALPHNILCLTFTEAGVRTMRQRLLDFIGPEAHKVHIHTFHSFCNKIIRENLEYFGRQDLEPLNDLEKVEILQNLLDELPFDHPLTEGRSYDRYFYLPHLSGLFQKMKAENWTPSFIVQKTDEYLADLPHRVEFLYQKNSAGGEKGTLKTALFQQECERMEKLKAAATLFPKYVNLLQNRRRYDYEDMILWVLKAFEKNIPLLRNYQEQYLYFLVDEYQDTNGAQNDVLKKLISYWDKPNIFIVGDDDQSIYEFQGARLKNLSEYHATYFGDLKVVVLKENYRSSQAILDLSRTLIEQNSIRIIHHLHNIGLDKILVAKNEIAERAIIPKIVEYPSRFHEISAIAAQIETLWQQGFPLEEIAVLYAEHKQANALVELLEKKGIPYQTKRKINALDLPVAQQVRHILVYLHHESRQPFSGESELFKLLHFECWDIHPNDLARIALYLAKAEKGQFAGLREAIGDAVLLEKMHLHRTEKILLAGQIIVELLRDVYNLALPHLVEKIVNGTGLLQWTTDAPERLQTLTTLHNFILKEAEKNPRLFLVRLLEIFDKMDAHRIALELQETAKTGAGVQLSTAHSAKGLEFQCVFLLDCVKDSWEPRARQNNYRFKLPDNLAFSGEEDAVEARRRLFYVAMTRAKSELQISYSLQNNDGKELQRTLFVDEIAQSGNLSMTAEAVDEKLLAVNQFLVLKAKAPQEPTLEPETVEEILKDFTLSVSAMNRFLDCPLSFYYEYILKIPSAPSEAASFGTAMHATLQRIFEKMLASKQKRFPTEFETVKIFEKEMARWRSFFSAASFERRLQSGSAFLKIYHQKNVVRWHKKVKLEYKISNLQVDGVPLTGVIDKVELHEQQTAHIVDYKTGSQKQEKLSRPTKSLPFGGAFWRQLVFYKILFEHYKNTPFRVETAEISYLEPDKAGNFLSPVLTFNHEDVTMVKGIIRDVYTKIRRQEFYEGCGKPDCVWCNFSKSLSAPTSFSSAELESLDDEK